jgi:hypothetical protein
MADIGQGPSLILFASKIISFTEVMLHHLTTFSK